MKSHRPPIWPRQNSKCRPSWKLVWLSTIIALASAAAGARAQNPAGAIQGRVVNGTTGKPVAKAQVNYVLMAQGMKPAASQVTDNDGRFRIDNPPSSGGGPALLRVEYEGATYSHPVLPGQSAGDVEIQVFDASKQPGIVSVKEHAIFVHPSGNTLLVLEQVILGNESSPPKTYVNEKGTYPFTLLAKALEGVQVTVEGPGGMPISQPAEPRDSANSYEINYAIRPGETQVRLEY